MYQATPDPRDRNGLGRRVWRRVTCTHQVVCRGTGGELTGVVVDLSRGGVLIALDGPAVNGDHKKARAVVEDLFPVGLEITFTRTGTQRRAKVARVTLQQGAHLGIGCAFDEALTTVEALRLGVLAGDCGIPEAQDDVLPYEPRNGTPLTLMLDGGDEDHVGPFALGSVVAAGDRIVEAVLPIPPQAVYESCGDANFHASLVVGRDHLWEGPVTLVACRMEATGGCRIRVVADAPIGRPLGRHFRFSVRSSA